MEFEEINSKDNPLLKRRELVLKVKAEGTTPKKNELADKVSSKYDVKDKKLIVVDSLKTSFGKLDCEAFVKIYESEEALNSIEPKPKEKKEKKSSNVPDTSGQIKVDLGDSEEKKVEGGGVEGSEKKEEVKEEAKPEEKKEEAPKEEPKPEEKK